MHDTEAVLRACWLSRLERAAVLCLLAAGGPRTGPELLGLVEARLGEPVGLGPLRFSLSRMAEVGILTSRKGRVGGYSIAKTFRDHLTRSDSQTVEINR